MDLCNPEDASAVMMTYRVVDGLGGTVPGRAGAKYLGVGYRYGPSSGGRSFIRDQNLRSFVRE